MENKIVVYALLYDSTGSHLCITNEKMWYSRNILYLQYRISIILRNRDKWSEQEKINGGQRRHDDFSVLAVFDFVCQDTTFSHFFAFVSRLIWK